MKKIIILFSLILTTLYTSFAGEVDQMRAERAAESFILSTFSGGLESLTLVLDNEIYQRNHESSEICRIMDLF